MNNVWEWPVVEHGKLTKWNWIVLYPEMLDMGKFIDIGAFTLIQAKYGVRIGNNVQIGGGVKIYSYNTIDDTHGPVFIDSGAKIGANSVILPGVTIGMNVTIGALSVVKHNVMDGVWAGSPLRRIK